MSQATLDDDELFGEAADEMRSDVEEHLTAARASLPVADEIWTVESDNTLGVLNGLKGALDTGDAEDHLRDAKKWYTMGERAGAFENGDDIEAELEELDGLVSRIQAARDQVADVASTLPELRSALETTGGDEDRDADGSEDGND